MSEIRSFSLTRTEATPVDPSTNLDRVLRGEIIICKGTFASEGYLAKIATATADAIKKHCGGRVANLVRENGFERIHDFVTGDQILSIYSELRVFLHQEMPVITRDLSKKLFNLDDPFYINENSLARFSVPHAILQENKKEFSKHLGKLDIHGPHHDYYAGVALNAINLWIAIGNVNVRNGLSIHTDVWGKTLEQSANGVVVKEGQYLGNPIKIECEPGDVVLFHGHHMHSAVLNSSDETRFVLTNRITIDKPEHPFNSPKFHYYRSDYLDGRPLVEARIPLEEDLPECRARKLQLADSSEKQLCPRDPSQMAEGKIYAKDRRTCAARLSGEVYEFSRRCPHQGADLSLGHIRDKKVYCPWHELGFDPRTGQSECDTIPPIKTENAPMSEM